MFCDVRGKDVLVVGGGSVALRKVLLLLDAGARVSVGALAICGDMALLVERGRVLHREGAYHRGWLAGQCLVIAATSDRRVNACIAQDAAALDLWVNVVDDPELSSFHVPAIVDRSPMVIAISSSGMAPVLARRMRERLESLLDRNWGSLAQLAARYRAGIRKRFGVVSERRRFYAWMLDGPVAAHIRQARFAEAESTLAQALAAGSSFADGLVSFVNVGSRDPGLLTLKGLRALNEADVVVYGRDIGDGVLALARRDADMCESNVDAGSLCGDGFRAQTLGWVREGLRVVHLLGAGDNAGREALMSHLLSMSICCEWIPGVAGIDPRCPAPAGAEGLVPAGYAAGA
ncbi:hypothetical protein GCM10027278_09640 [Paralcaligenes ginsengisoli]